MASTASLWEALSIDLSLQAIILSPMLIFECRLSHFEIKIGRALSCVPRSPPLIEIPKELFFLVISIVRMYCSPPIFSSKNCLKVGIYLVNRLSNSSLWAPCFHRSKFGPELIVKDQPFLLTIQVTFGLIISIISGILRVQIDRIFEKFSRLGQVF